jgi:hypothetical protein
MRDRNLILNRQASIGIHVALFMDADVRANPQPLRIPQLNRPSDQHVVTALMSQLSEQAVTDCHSGQIGQQVA